MRNVWDSVILTLALAYFLFQQLKTPTVTVSQDPSAAVTCWLVSGGNGGISCLPDGAIYPRLEPVTNPIR